MGEKLKPQFEMEDFPLPDEGVNVFRVEDTSVVKERKEGKPGWEYKVRLVQEGGGADGAKHFESFFTDTKNDFSLRKMLGFLIKIGVYKEDAEVDSDTFRTDTFANNWKKLMNKKLGLMISIEKRKDDPSKARSIAKKYMSLKEAQDAMKGGGGSTTQPKANQPELSEGWDE